MSTTTEHGSPQFPAASESRPASLRAEMDTAVQTLQKSKDVWVAIPAEERVAILDVLLHDVAAVAPRMVEIANQAKGVSGNPQFAGEEWQLGPYPLQKNLRQLRQSLADIVRYGKPRIPGPVTTRSNGQVVAQVFPQNLYDRLFFTGVRAEIWMQPGVTPETLPSTQAISYQQPPPGRVALVLGAGNVASIPSTDTLYKLFVEDQVVLLKMNPINAYLGPLIAEAFQALIERNVLRITYGGGEEGAYLCQHPGIDEIHVTGSDKTYDAIVFGPGREGADRKAAHKPLITKRVTSELGNVSPVIIVPGPWSAADLKYHAVHLVTSLVMNAGFNCNASRVLIQHQDWPQRAILNQEIRNVLKTLPTRPAYYPGAQDRQQAFLTAYTQAEQFGSGTGDLLPWTFISDVDPSNQDDLCFTTEAFCGVFAETALPGSSIADYIDHAVNFANKQLWGSLNVTLLVHPTSLKDPTIAAAVERAIADLHYGTVSINYWAATSYALSITSWGAFPGHTSADIQSGTGVVHNTLMFSQIQKSVLHAPFRSWPTPPWFAGRGKVAAQVFPRLVALETSPSLWKIPTILRAALSD